MQYYMTLTKGTGMCQGTFYPKRVLMRITACKKKGFH